MEFLGRLGELDREQALGQAQYHLNRWIEDHEPSPDWKVDPMTTRLPRAIRESDLLDGVNNWTFSGDDIEAMQEAVWLRDIAQWVSERPADPRLKAWLDQNESLDEVQREQLTIAERLFDWTVRNLQLAPTTPYPEETLEPSAGGDQTQRKRIPAPQRAAAGPGYRFTPQEALLYGSADTVRRSSIFMLLARQQGIDVVYLAIPGQTVPPRPRPWVTAVLLGQELFLFDCELGLPIPGPHGKGIATLSQVLDAPEMLTALDVDDLKYPVREKDLAEIMVLLHASPPALSQRLKLVESNLAGDQRTMLTSSPSQLAERVKACRGISFSVIWSLPFETIWYRQSWVAVLKKDPRAAVDYEKAVGLFQNQGPLVQARHLHLRRQFQDKDDKPGAKTLYMQCRMPEAAIEQLETSAEVQQHLGLTRGREEGEFLWQVKLARAKHMAVQSKRTATYWLGLCHYDGDNYRSAISFFEQRTLEATPDGPWTFGARYNLARAYEAVGKLEKAGEVLSEEDDSPQKHGNHLRAKLLKQWAASETTDG
jgi:tetratricopeptide (TPR) repeat protein